MKHTKKMLAAFLFTLALALVIGLGLTAYAADPVSYMAWSDTAKKLEQQSCTSYTVVTAETTAFANNTWYVVNEDVGSSSNPINRITVTGTANLILCDNTTLYCKGITVAEGNTLNIYAQSEGLE